MRSFFPLLILMACGGGSIGPNGLFVTRHDKARIDVLLEKARMAYDKGDLDQAEEYSSEVYNLNTKNQDAALMLANVRMAKAKLSLLDIAGEISDNLKVSSGTATNTKALDVLGVLGDVTDISAAEYAELGTLRNNTGITLFADLDVIEPFAPGNHKTTTSPRHKVEPLRFIGESIDLLCPFLPAKATDGSTDTRDTCTKVTNSTSMNQPQSLFTFAMAHLFEAIFLVKVLMYTTGTSTSTSTSTSTDSAIATNSNLFRRVKAIEGLKFSVSNASTYLSAVTEVVRNVSKVFDSGSTDSMLTAIMVDLRVTTQSLGAIDGFPKDLLAKIADVQTTINKAVTKAGQSTSSISSQTKALNDQLSATALAKLNASITTYLASIPSGQQAETVTAVCAEYKKVTEIFGVTTAPVISRCQ